SSGASRRSVRRSSSLTECGQVHVDPARADGVDRNRARLVGRTVTTPPTGEHALEPLVGEVLDLALAPLDHGHGLVEGGIEVEVVHLCEPTEAIGVDVYER